MAESCKEGCGLKSAVLLMMIVVIVVVIGMYSG
jgi:hypothetical protein